MPPEKKIDKRVTTVKVRGAEEIGVVGSKVGEYRQGNWAFKQASNDAFPGVLG
jgi:hypothetical protein